MRTPLITLTTDFGLVDHYAGVMKGVMLGIAPAARFVDITHNAAAHSVADGAFSVLQTYPYFPPGTVHLVVVDPGVGSARGAVAVAMAGQYFVAPDNGVLSYAMEREPWLARSLDRGKLGLAAISQTFHGRDLFAPAAARLARGMAFDDAGEPAGELVRLAPLEAVRDGGVWRGRVLHVDVFGNVVTSFPSMLLDEAPGGWSLGAGRQEISAIADSYTGIPPGTVAMVAGSAGFLELSMQQASAAAGLGLRTGDALTLRNAAAPKTSGKYADGRSTT